MGPAVAQGAGGSLHDMGRGGEIGLADLEMNDLFSLSFESAGAHQYLEGALVA